MDAYTEQLVVIKKTPITIILRILMWFIDITSSVMLFILALSFAPLFAGIITTILFVFIFALNYMVVILNRRFNMEYEYIRTDNYLDIDRVFSGRSRERLASINLKEVEKIGVLSENDSFDVKKKLLCTNPDDELFYIIFKHPKHGKTICVFSPDDRLKEGLKFYIPRQVWFDAFGRN